MGIKAVSRTDAYGRSLIYRAVKSSSHAALQVLLSLGAPVDVGNLDNGWSPLALAAWMGNSLAIDCLLEHGADADFKQHTYSWTPLIAAASKGDIQLCHKLIDHGANLLSARLQLENASVKCFDIDAMFEILQALERERKGAVISKSECGKLLNCDRSECTVYFCVDVSSTARKLVPGALSLVDRAID